MAARVLVPTPLRREQRTALCEQRPSDVTGVCDVDCRKYLTTFCASFVSRAVLPSPCPLGARMRPLANERNARDGATPPSLRSTRHATADVSKKTMVERCMTSFDTFATLSDPDLLAAVEAAARCERASTAELVALLVYVDGRRLYLGQGCSSLFTYCTQVLHLSEHAAYGRIEAARAARRFPILLDRLAEGAVTLTTVTLLAPHLTPDNHDAVLRAARHKTKRDVEHLVARLRP